MKEKMLLAYRRGEIGEARLLEEHGEYVAKMAGYFGRAECVRAVHSHEDLVSIARVEIWIAANAYRWRCQACARSLSSEVDFAAHRAARHPGFVEGPFPKIGQYVHGRVGRALHRAAHKPLVDAKRMGRTVRIDVGAGFEVDEPRARISVPSHEEQVAFRDLLAKLDEELGPGTRELAERIAGGDHAAAKTRAGRRLAEWLRRVA